MVPAYKLFVHVCVIYKTKTVNQSKPNLYASTPIQFNLRVASVQQFALLTPICW